jgi:DNA-directed DNA polymerase III PolC
MFTHLHCHSYYSFLRGTAAPAALAHRAAELGMSALALTDRDGVCGSVEFYLACREAGVKPILGVELTEPDDSPKDGSKRICRRPLRAVFLARNRRGWRRVCELTTARQLAEDFSLSQAVRDAGDDLFVLTDSPELAAGIPPRLSVLEVTSFMGLREREEIIRFGRAKKIPVAAANDVYFSSPDDYSLARLLACIRTRSGWKDIPPPEVPHREARLKSGREMEDSLGAYPEVFSTTRWIADECNLELELGRLHLPRYPLPPGESAPERLRSLCREGVKKRYGVGRIGMKPRLEKELGVISRLGMADYFLLVEEIVGFAKGRGISTLGRGSAANSLVCYLLGITGVDPLRYNLYFERFLNDKRTDPPDIDLDFPTNRRDEVVNWIYRRFGSDRVATLSTTVRFRARSALRETARVMGMGEAGARRLTRNLPYYSNLSDPDRIRREAPECRDLPWNDPGVRKIMTIAARLEGIPRHLSVHPGGMVITPEPLISYLALTRASKGVVVTQPDMYSVKELGLIKIDILGQRALAVVEDVIRGAGEGGEKIDFDGIDPTRDKATRELIANGRTIGCFYVESPVMRNLLKRLRCREFETLVAASSIIRPGVSSTGCAESYIARHLGRETPASIHPRVDEILRETHGVMIYQEQVMRVVSEAAGLSLADGDEFRRCMSKKPGWQALTNYRERFIRGAVRNHIPRKTAVELWRRIEGFAAYAFCQAHSASFARLSYQTAYLKAHYPARFMAALISNRGGFYPTREYVREAGRMGIQIYPPDVNRSDYPYRAEGEGIRVGLMEVKGLRQNTIRMILKEREDCSYRSWENFLSRVHPNSGELMKLIHSGALDSLGESRSALAWHLAAARSHSALTPDKLFPRFREESGPPLPAFKNTPADQRRAEEDGLGFSLLPPEAEDLRRELKKFAPSSPIIQANEQMKWEGKDVQLVGDLVTARLNRTRDSGRLMKFLTMEDATGLFEVVLFPEIYARYGHHLANPGPFYIRGTVQVKDQAPTIIGSFLSGI